MEQPTSGRSQDIWQSVEREDSVPHKYVYVDEDGAALWDRIARDPAFSLGQNELRVLREGLPDVLCQVTAPRLILVHLGPGNGVEVPALVEAIGAQRIEHYMFVDISPALLNLADCNMRAWCPGLKVRKVCCDVQSPEVSELLSGLHRDSAPILVALIGNGGILSDQRVLELLRKGLTPNDYLLITLELYQANRQDTILDEYRLDSIVALFEKSLVPLGIKEGARDYLIFGYNPARRLVDVDFDLAGWRRSRPGVELPQVLACKTRLRVFSSFKPTVPQLLETLASNGWCLEAIHTNGSEAYVAVLCRPKKAFVS